MKNKKKSSNILKLNKKMRIIAMPKIRNIYYSYHISNFLAGIVNNQRSLKLKYTYFFTKFLYRFSKTLNKLGLVSSVKVLHKKIDTHFKKNLTVPDFRKKKEEIEYGFILSKDRPNIEINLKYISEKPVVQSILMYSKPGRRLYVSCYSLEKLAKLNPGSVIIISNSYYGVIDHLHALKVGIGGLLLCKIN